MKDTRIAYGATCTWWGAIQEVATTGSGLPCCPHCRGVLFEAPSMAEWEAGTRQSIDAGNAAPDWLDMLHWVRDQGEPCQPNFDEIQTRYRAAVTA